MPGIVDSGAGNAGGQVDYADLVTSGEVVLVMAGVPAAIMVVLGLLTLRPHLARARRYRPGQPWDYPPVLWTANPPGWRARSTDHHRSAPRGGASGHW